MRAQDILLRRIESLTPSESTLSHIQLQPPGCLPSNSFLWQTHRRGTARCCSRAAARQQQLHVGKLEKRSTAHRCPKRVSPAQLPRKSERGLTGLIGPGLLTAAAAIAIIVRSAEAVVGGELANSIAAAVPESITATVAPVVQKTSAVIPGLLGDSPLREGIVSGFLLILFSELGDKTFFLALLLALKESKSVVFAGTFGALAVMTVISVALGQLIHQIDEFEFTGSKLPLDDYLAVALLIFFGVKTILDAQNADESAAEEREEAEEEVSNFRKGATGLFLSTFTLVFAAEWGDKSFLATIALAAASSPTGVVLGAIGGHGLATGIAVLGGSYLGKYLDEKVVQYLGGSLFLVFAAATIVDIARGV